MFGFSASKIEIFIREVFDQQWHQGRHDPAGQADFIQGEQGDDAGYERELQGQAGVHRPGHRLLRRQPQLLGRESRKEHNQLPQSNHSEIVEEVRH